MTAPLITAAVTAYNAAATIRQALQSALMQTWPRLEVVIVDDASGDGTPAIIADLIARHDRPDRPIRLLRHARNQGVAAARNRLIEAAKGEFIAFFDDDDVSLPERISRQHERLLQVEAAGHDLVICHTARLQVFPDNRRRIEATMGAGAVVPHGAAVADRILLGRMTPGAIGSCAACSQLGRVATYRLLGGFDESLRRSEDTELNIRLALKGCAFAGIAEPLVQQAMTDGDEKTLIADDLDYTAALSRHDAYLEAIGWGRFSRRWRRIRRAALQGRHLHCAALLARLALAEPGKTLAKLAWSLPARGSRQSYASWQHAKAAMNMVRQK